jgi:phage shock protein C
MYCTKCGTNLDDKSRFCSDCGAPTTNNAPSVQPYPKLSRPRDDRKIAGVCAGFARYLGVDVTLVRLIFLVLAIVPPTIGLIAYIVAWIVMPNDPLRLPAATQPASASGPVSA